MGIYTRDLKKKNKQTNRIKKQLHDTYTEIAYHLIITIDVYFLFLVYGMQRVRASNS